MEGEQESAESGTQEGNEESCPNCGGPLEKNEEGQKVCKTCGPVE